MDSPRSIFAVAAGPRAKWVVFLVWLVGIFIAVGPAQLPTKFTDAENNESTSYLPGDAESTKALSATEDLQGGELAPAVIVYHRESGLTAADGKKIQEDVARLTKRRFPGVVRDGAKAAGGGPQVRRPNGCAGPATTVPGQPNDYAPFVGPICSPDGKAAILTAYIRGNGQGDTILDPVDYWRDNVSDPGGGLQVKITGGAGYSADAIKVFEGINGTLLLAAVSLVIVLLILIYRSPIFLRPEDVPKVRRAAGRVDGVELVSGPVAQGKSGVLIQATLVPQPYSTEAFDLIDPIRDAAHRAVPGTLVGGASAVEFDVRDAAAWDSAV